MIVRIWHISASTHCPSWQMQCFTITMAKSVIDNVGRQLGITPVRVPEGCNTVMMMMWCRLTQKCSSHITRRKRRLDGAHQCPYRKMRTTRSLPRFSSLLSLPSVDFQSHRGGSGGRLHCDHLFPCSRFARMLYAPPEHSPRPGK
jgi:hypothetical protein